MFILLLTPATSRGGLGGDSNSMHLSDLSFQRFRHQLVLFHKAHPSKVWGLDEYLIHAATASTDVDHGDVGGVGEGFGQGRDYHLLAGAWGA